MRERLRRFWCAFKGHADIQLIEVYTSEPEQITHVFEVYGRVFACPPAVVCKQTGKWKCGHCGAVGIGEVTSRRWLHRGTE